MNRQKSPIFERAAMFFYKRCCIKGLPLFASAQVERDLAQLHPGENIQYLKTEYYVKKLSLALKILCGGALFGLAAKYAAGGEVLLQEDGSLQRGSYLEGEREVCVTTQIDGEQQEFQVNIHPRVLSRAEAEGIAADFLENLPGLIQGENESLTEVTENLRLEETYEGYPFLVEWESSNPAAMSPEGVAAAEEKKQIELLARISYEGWQWEKAIPVTVCPPVCPPGEKLHGQLQEYLKESEQESRLQETWSLPEKWQGESLRWSQKVEDNSLQLWAFALAAAVAIYLFSDKDLHEKLEKRKQKMRREYPDIVHQLVLFVGAGMTLRGAFERIAAEYEKKQGKAKEKRPAYEEMLYTCHELKAGVSEGAAYERFGRRTGLREYVRLSTLLMQNLKRGNSTLLERLREEAEKAGEERLMQSRRLGEEAGTKLLFPMVLMLGVVMVMIMVPAFATL